MRVEYKDAEGKNEIGAEVVIYADAKDLTIGVSVQAGDGDGDYYTIYAPNHIEKIETLIAELQDVLEKSRAVPKGFDGFSFNYASAAETGNTFDDPAGVVSWY